MANDIQNSILRYGGIDLPFIKTELFQQEPVWSPDGTDLLYFHITIGISGVLHQAFLGGQDPADWIETNRPTLLQRGNKLYFYIGGTQVMPPPGSDGSAIDDTPPDTGTELVASPHYKSPADSNPQATITAPLDAKLGPKPIQLDIRAIRGGAFAFYYRIETWVPYCNSSTAPAAILSNRWESVLDIDKDYYYTRTTNGTLILNGQYLESTPAPNTLSTNAVLILPPLFKIWKREMVRFTLSSDQLTLTYTIQDRQQYVASPRPCAHIEASYAEVMPARGEDLALINMQQLNMDVTVTGDPSVLVDNSYPTAGDNGINPDQLKYMLMQIMFELVFSRIQFPFINTGSQFGTQCMITHFELREDLMHPIVGCRVVAFRTRSLAANQFGAAAEWVSNIFSITNVGGPIYLDDMIDQIASQPISIGNWATFLLLCSVVPTDPCYGGHIPVSGNQYSPYAMTTGSAQTSSAQTSTGSAYTQTVNLSYSQANYKFPFSEYSATVSFPTDNHILQLPVMYDVDSTPSVPSSFFCQTAAPTSRKIIHWKASRIGSWPKAPRPDAVDLYGGAPLADKMLHYTPEMAEVELSNDGITRHYAISGIYEIGMARRLQWDVPSSVLSTICNPIIASSVYGDADASFPTSNFIHGLTDPGTSPGNS